MSFKQSKTFSQRSRKAPRNKIGFGLYSPLAALRELVRWKLALVCIWPVERRHGRRLALLCILPSWRSMSRLLEIGFGLHSWIGRRSTLFAGFGRQAAEG
jgi:hypothetical protein